MTVEDRIKVALGGLVLQTLMQQQEIDALKAQLADATPKEPA